MTTDAASPRSRLPRSCIAILGVPFDSVSMDDAVSIVEEMVESGRPHYLATANVDFTVQALEDEELRRILFDAHLVVCDGTPLLWASRWLGHRLPERVAGSDLVPILIRLAARKGHRIYFLGGRPDVTERAIANITRDFPGLNVVGSDSPPFAPLHQMDHAKIGEKIRAARPDMLFVSFGCPKQEKWIAMNYRALGVPVCVGVGATIDFLAGEMMRAPVWMRRCGLEWLFRLLQEPRRLFQRYVKDFWVFGRGLCKQWWHMRPSRKTPAPPVPLVASLTAPTPDEAEKFTLPERLDAAFVCDHAVQWQSLGAKGVTLLAEASQVGFVDSTGVGALIRLRKQLREKDAELILVSASPALLRGLDLMKLSGLFTKAPDWFEARSQAARLDNERKSPVQSVLRDTAPKIGWSGDVTAATVDAVWDRTALLLDAQASHAEAEMAIDLEKVSFVDSAGLGFMVRVQRMARQHGLSVRYVNPSEPVQRVVRMAKLEEFLLGNAA
jgi:N-acetylglucosaminyldiphosphoundecaprenol N-acetyl-beta-D-mannosaminyltransferase